MVSNALLYGAGAIFASEATGVTNFTSIGGSTGDIGERGTPEVPGLGGLSQAMENVRSQTDGIAAAMGEMEKNQIRMQERISATQDMAKVMSETGGTEIIEMPTEGVGGNGGPNVDVKGIVDSVIDGMPDREDLPEPNNDETTEPETGVGDEDRSWQSGWEIARNPGTWLDDQGEAAPTILGASPDEFKEGEGLLGRSYNLGRATGEGVNEVNDYYDRINQQYRDATSGARETVETAKDITRPWRWDTFTGDSGNVDVEPDTGEIDKEHTPGAIDSDVRDTGTDEPDETEESIAGMDTDTRRLFSG